MQERKRNTGEDIRLHGYDLLVSAIAAVLRITIVGMPLGVGNQSLHIVFIEHLRDPQMFRGDLLLDTLPHFTTWFFHAFAWILPDLVPTDLALVLAHVITTFLIFTAMVYLVRGIWPESRVPSLILIPMVVLSLSGLAESPLNPLAFSHTSFAFALSLIALNYLVRHKLFLALMLVGLLANIHLLTAAYAVALVGMWGVWNIKSLPRLQTIGGIAAAIVLSLPVLHFLQQSPGGFDARWLELIELRSAHHVFSSTWWDVGDTSIARFALWVGWAALARGLTGGKNRHTDPWIASAAVLMLVGWVGTELIQIPLVMRAQLFRISGYVVVSALLLTTGFVDMTISRADMKPVWLFLTRVFALILAAVVFLPFGQPFHAPALLACAWIACAAKKLSSLEAAVIGSVIIIATLSDIRLDTGFWTPSWPSIPSLYFVLLIFAALILASSLYFNTRVKRSMIVVSIVLLAVGGILQGGGQREPGDWEDIQVQTRHETPADARILTPPRQNGFRLHSHRAIVGEWRDGTQQFFDPGFAVDWAQRMRSLDPEETRYYDASEWISMAEKWEADFIVLPRDERLRLVRVAENDTWMLCLPEKPPPPPLPDPPEMALDPDDWLEQERFMVEVVEPSLRRNRTSAVELKLVDESGRPVPGAAVELKQTGREFHIGSSLNHFAEPSGHSHEFRAPLVHEKELEYFLKVFNYSVIPYSGKWIVIEPEEGKRNLEPVDSYLDWAERHGVEVEYHFVTGYPPRWLEEKSEEEQQKALLRHAEDLIDRYGDRIRLWQIVNERHLLSLAPPVYKLFQERLPDAKLSVSHCARFYTPREGERRMRALMLGWDQVEELRRHGAKIDFFAVHAHRPFGLWSDPRTMYEVLDEYESRDMPVRISEAGISYAGNITGTVMEGEWNEELQAEYLRRFLTVLYSHPNVDGVNFWGFGPDNWQANIGLLDENYEPRPAFDELYRLVNEEWHTHVHRDSGRSGRFRFRGFHGNYELNARLPDGREVSTDFDLNAETPDRMEIRLPLR